MSNKEPDNVYILTNPSFRKDWVKITMNTSVNTIKRLLW